MSNTSKDFETKVLTTIEHGFQSLLLAAGYKLKLFEHLGDEAEPRSSQEIAKLAKYKERYIREWLSGMVVAGFVECDPSGKTFWMKRVAKEAFGKDGIKGTLAVAQALPCFAPVFDQICDCFKLEGPSGVPYSAYSSFHEFMASISDPDFEVTLIPKFVPSVPGLQEQLERGITCLDVGCGTGAVTLLLAARFPKSQFYGLDISDEAIKRATTGAQEKSLPNAHFVAADAKQLPQDWTSKFEYATAFDAIHDLPRPDLALAEILRVLKPGGRVSVVDVDAKSNVYENKGDPKSSFMYTASLFHCMPVSLYFPDGFGLGNMWGIEKALALLKDVGFGQVDILDAPTEGKLEAHYRVHYICTKPTA